MKNLNKFLALFSTLFILSFFSCVSNPKPNKSNSEENKAPKVSRKYNTIEIKEKTEYMNVDVEFPTFASFPDLTMAIRDTVESDLEVFKEEVEEEWRLMKELNPELPPFDYITEYKVTYTSRIISVALENYTYIGGTHGNTIMWTFNYDSDENTFLDIVQATGRTYNEISKICQAKLKRYSEVLDPVPENFKIFTVRKDTATVYFMPYEVASYADGIQTVDFTIK